MTVASKLVPTKIKVKKQRKNQHLLFDLSSQAQSDRMILLKTLHDMLNTNLKQRSNTFSRFFGRKHSIDFKINNIIPVSNPLLNQC
jgi:hypothetical protein